VNTETKRTGAVQIFDATDKHHIGFVEFGRSVEGECEKTM